MVALVEAHRDRRAECSSCCSSAAAPWPRGSPRATSSAAPTATRCGRTATRGRSRRTGRTDCVQCHIPPGSVNFVETKLAASREVWVHFTGQVKAPIKVTRHIPDCGLPALRLPHQRPDRQDVLARPRRRRSRSSTAAGPHAAAVHRVPRVPGPRRRAGRDRSAGELDAVVLHVPPRRAPRTARTATRRRTATEGRASTATASAAGAGGKAGGPHPGGALTGKHGADHLRDVPHPGRRVKPDGCITCHGDQHNGLTQLRATATPSSSWDPSAVHAPAGGPAHPGR